jgi:hypothetical protein
MSRTSQNQSTTAIKWRQVGKYFPACGNIHEPASFEGGSHRDFASEEPVTSEKMADADRALTGIEI